MTVEEIKKRWPFVKEVWISLDREAVGIRVDERRYMFPRSQEWAVIESMDYLARGYEFL